ncbi:unnamed protein product [Callosobruchus maculatus]|uniref:Uncharacterized protein n=1 Tax=Callosobruchus maculatus TaxID=64391 RepID=A0A653DYN1_CALMS|nr:unnamed protein product [Callosobruchus maculatus]
MDSADLLPTLPHSTRLVNQPKTSRISGRTADLATSPAESPEPRCRREKILLCEKVERHLITAEINMRYVVPGMSLLSKIGHNIFHLVLRFAGQFRLYGQ